MADKQIGAQMDMMKRWGNHINITKDGQRRTWYVHNSIDRYVHTWDAWNEI